jgi:prephenate dehydratase
MKRYKETGDRDTDAVLRGINEIDERMLINRQMRLAEIHELVTSVADRSPNADAAISSLEAIRPVRNIEHTTSALERVALCREYLKIYPDMQGFKKELFFGSDETVSESAANKIAYIMNSYTDEAFRRFSRELENGSEAVSVVSFEELCEDVYSGSCEYGIIPIENTENGKLARFYSLINKYDLKIAAMLDIANSGSNTETGFALIRKNIEYPKLKIGKPYMFEMFVMLREAETFSEILAAADFCNMSLYRIDSFPISHQGGKYTLCPVFKTEHADIDSFLLYMSLDFPRYTPIGIYSHLT